LALVTPERVGTLHVEFLESANTSRWLLIAMVGDRGLLIVDATEESSGWDGDSAVLNRVPAKFSAELIGLNRIAGLDLMSVRDVNVPFAPASRRLEAQWSLRIEGREAAVVFPIRPEHESASAAAIARAISGALAGAPLPIWSD
jgi:hypothetical protein